MRLFLSILIFLSTVGAGHAVQYPVMTNAKMTRCGPSGCSIDAWYQGTIAIMEIGVPLTPPSPRRPGESILDLRGVACIDGNVSGEFRRCSWNWGGLYVPLNPGKCALADGASGSWALTADSTCTAASTWGGHRISAPGSDCVMFGQMVAGGLLTPWGLFTAEAAANSGDAICSKPLQPNTHCEVLLPSAIDHGVVSAGYVGSAFIEGTVDCGGSAKVYVVGSSTLMLAPTVKTTLSAKLITPTQLRVQSDMSVGASTVGGTYSASVIISVSPY